MAVTPNSFSALNSALKDNYLPFEQVLIYTEAAWWKMFKSTSAFKLEGGGKNMTFPLAFKRPHNYGARTETGLMPGFSSRTNDDLTIVTTDNAVVGRKHVYNSYADTLRLMSQPDAYNQFSGWDMGFHLKQMQEDFDTYMDRQALGDGTAILGVVSGTPTTDLTNTTIVLQPASTISDHGVHGTQRLQANQKVSFIKAADWASGRRTARIHSNLGGLGNTEFVLSSATGPNDVGASPTIIIGGDLITSGTPLQNGDIVVHAASRTTSTTGGNNASTELLEMDGLFSYIDDATLTSTCFGLSRTTYPTLNAQVDLSTSARPLSWLMGQIMGDKLNRRMGDKGISESDYFLLTERSVRTGYVGAEGEAAKRYAQQDKAMKLMPGWGDVQMVFLGNDRPVPWICVNNMPYGHAVFGRKSQLKAFWDRKPGIINEDGLTIRQSAAGSPVFTSNMAGYGQLLVTEPWTAGRMSGLQGAFSAAAS